MKEEQEINIPEILKDRARVQKALRDGVQKALRMHKLMGVPAVVWEDGKVVEIPPDEIKLLDETNGTAKIPGQELNGTQDRGLGGDTVP